MMNLKAFPSVHAALKTLDFFDSAPTFHLKENPVIDRLFEFPTFCDDLFDLHDAALKQIDSNVIHLIDGGGLVDAGIGVDRHLWIRSRLHMLNDFDGADVYTSAICGLVVDRLAESCDATVFYGVDWTNTETTFGRLLYCDSEKREAVGPHDPSNWRFCTTERLVRRSL